MSVYFDFEVLSRVVFIVVTSVTFSIALIAYSRVRKTKALVILFGFTLFFIHGLLSIPGIFDPSFNGIFNPNWQTLLDGAAILVLLIGTLMD